MTSLEYPFQCPLPNGLHARPASQLADVAARFLSEITLTNDRNGTNASAKSVLGMVALDVQAGDACRLRICGADAETARAAMHDFVSRVLPVADEPLPATVEGAAPPPPRSLREAAARWLCGTPVSGGIGQGHVLHAGGLSLGLPAEGIAAGPALDEQRAFHDAVSSLRHDLERRMGAPASKAESGILAAHLAIAGDVDFARAVEALLSRGASAATAIVNVGRDYVARLSAAGSAYIRERAADVEDLCLQLLARIYGDRFAPPPVRLSRPSIVVAEQLSPHQLLSMDRRLLAGLVIAHAGRTSHVVILARSFSIPTLVGVVEARARLAPGREAVVDANLGIVIPDVTVSVRRHYERERRKLRRRMERFEPFIAAPATTRDNNTIQIGANVATAEELAPAFKHGADGVGLFRTEMLFMDRDAAPTEDEQYAVFAQAARAAGGRPVIIRTFDVGGDKPVPYLNLPREENPFLGLRGVRVYRAHADVFRAHLRAIVRASAHGGIWAMAPMVSSLEEARWFRAQVRDVQAELGATNAAFDAKMPVGIMVEVPSAALIIDQLSREVDFFSIGTNDLLQSFLAVDRGSAAAADQYSALHPSFLRLLARIVADARQHGRWVGMCGEMAGSVENLPLVLGLGLDEISTAAPEIPALKAATARFSSAACRSLVEHAMTCESVTQVRSVLAAFHQRDAAENLLETELVIVDSDAATKAEAIKEIIDAFFVAGRTGQPERVEDAVWAREDEYSTGLGHGIAIPHCKTDAIAANSIGVARLRRPVDWGAVDGEPVHCVILLAMRASDRNGTHLQVFSKLARNLMREEFRDRLLSAHEAPAILACLTDELGLARRE